MRKVIKVLSALILSLALITFTACDFIDGFFNKPSGSGNGGTSGGGSNNSQTTPGGTEGEGNGGNGGSASTQTYNITFELNGGTLSQSMNSYEAGKDTDLPTPTKTGYGFGGWYINNALSGDAVTKITATDTGDKTFYAKWVVETYKVSLNIVGSVDAGAYTGANNVTSYSYDAAKTLPTPSKSGYNFSGWYTDANLNGTPVTAIPKNSTGDKTYYGRFISLTELVLNSYGGYDEGAYVEFNTVSGVSDYSQSVTYKPKTGASAYTSINKELIRVKDGKVRADIVGLKAGDYKVKVVAGDKQVEKDVTVTAYDRSGYAHFNYTDGVGGYKDEGTPKSGAYIIYVNEATKNSVKAPWDSNLKGIANILSSTSIKNKKVIVRVIGTVGAATWKKDNVTYTKTTGTNGNTDSKGNLLETAIVGKNGSQLPKPADSSNAEKDKLSQANLIAGGYNELDTSKYSVLDGLVSKATYKSGEYDSYWNNCEISGASNITIEGIGTDAMIFQWGFTWKSCNSIEVRNLTFDDYTEDACSFEGSTGTTTIDGFNSQRLWVHHNTINQGMNYWDVCPEQDKHEGDGGTDFKGVSYVTIAYNHYYNNHKTGLVGGDNAHNQANMTFHHNYYQECNSRLPLARQANMHMYNNYYYKSSGTNMSLRANAYAFIEKCYFDGCKVPLEIQGIKKDGAGQAGTYGVAKLYDCTVSSTCGAFAYASDTINANDLTNNKSKMIVETSNRKLEVTSNNKFSVSFENSSSNFYLNSDGTSKVSNLIATSKVPTEIPKVAGVHKNK